MASIRETEERARAALPILQARHSHGPPADPCISAGGIPTPTSWTEQPVESGSSQRGHPCPLTRPKKPQCTGQTPQLPVPGLWFDSTSRGSRLSCAPHDGVRVYRCRRSSPCSNARLTCLGIEPGEGRNGLHFAPVRASVLRTCAPRQNGDLSRMVGKSPPQPQEGPVSLRSGSP